MVAIKIAQPADEDPTSFKGQLDHELDSIRFYVDSQLTQIAEFNAGLETAVRSAVRARRARIEKHTGLESLLGIPLARRDGAPEAAPIPMQRKLVRPLPPPPKSGYKPEPGITDADYDHILSVVRHEGRILRINPGNLLCSWGRRPPQYHAGSLEWPLPGRRHRGDVQE